VPRAALAPGAGSSDLIFRALREWLTPASRALILDPTYGEYAHVLERVIGCHVRRLSLRREHGYRLDTDVLEARVRALCPDLVVLVNPNSPTGTYVDRDRMRALLSALPRATRVWIDETYVDYVGPGASLEDVAAESHNVFVCKSMSKVYALSGMRAAYLCGPPGEIARIRAITPPWVIGLPAQVAAVAALRDPQYYRQCYSQTHRLRDELASQISRRLGWDVLAGVANFLLAHLPPDGITAEMLVERCRRRGLFVRDASTMGRLGRFAVRIAVKSAADNARMLDILCDVVGRESRGASAQMSIPAAATAEPQPVSSI
jgi:histidinol-phosphate/aromatic aminotransferase/cobyric acid decarboxylase-like protein